jgi:nitrite reductase/ring-hydroxylating ferredoxin subunit
MWQEVAAVADIAPGGMIGARAGGDELCVCEFAGAYYAVSRRCGHQNAPLEQGALEGWVLTCPLHHAQYDIRTGRNLSWPTDPYLGSGPLPEPVERFFRLEHRLQRKILVHDLRTYPVRVRAGSIEVDLPVTTTAEDR